MSEKIFLLCHVKSNKMTPSRPTTPGEHLAHLLEERKISQSDLAQKVGMTRPYLNGVINGKYPFNHKLARRLESVLQVESTYWMELLRQWEKYGESDQGRQEIQREAETQLVGEWSIRGRGYMLGWEVARARKAGMIGIDNFQEDNLQADGSYVARLGEVNMDGRPLDLRKGISFRRNMRILATTAEIFSLNEHIRMEFAGLSENFQLAFVQTPQSTVLPSFDSAELTLPLINAVGDEVELEIGLELAIVRFYFDAEVPTP
jgi:plasmid maintenance system antidote protein VapI